MKLIISFLICLFPLCSFAQEGQNSNIKACFDLNNLFSGDGFSIPYIGYERVIAKRQSLTLLGNYDLKSTNIITNKTDNIINNQIIRAKLDYHFYLTNNAFNGVYLGLSGRGGICITNADNEKAIEYGGAILLGYQIIILDNIAIDLNIEKGYLYSRTKNDNIEMILSNTTDFKLFLSLGFCF